jgi:hypothetical protein
MDRSQRTGERSGISEEQQVCILDTYPVSIWSTSRLKTCFTSEASNINDCFVRSWEWYLAYPVDNSEYPSGWSIIRDWVHDSIGKLIASRWRTFTPPTEYNGLFLDSGNHRRGELQQTSQSPSQAMITSYLSEFSHSQKSRESDSRSQMDMIRSPEYR